jgi:hypothetical protein
MKDSESNWILSIVWTNYSCTLSQGIMRNLLNRVFGECSASSFYVQYVLFKILLHLIWLLVTLFGWSPGEHMSSLLICVYRIDIHGIGVSNCYIYHSFPVYWQAWHVKNLKPILQILFVWTFACSLAITLPKFVI